MADGLNIEEEISAVKQLLALWQELGDFTRPLWEDGDYTAFRYRRLVVDSEHEARYASLRERITRLYAGLARTIRTYGGTVTWVKPALGIKIENYDTISGLFHECPDLRSLTTSVLAPGSFKLIWNQGYQILNMCLGRLEAERRHPSPERAATGRISSAQRARAKASGTRAMYRRLVSFVNWTERNLIVRALIIIGGIGAGIAILWIPGKAIWGRLQHAAEARYHAVAVSPARTGAPGAENAAAPPTAMEEEVRVSDVREIPSRYDDAPNGLEIVLQTTVPLQPIYLNIRCADPIEHVEVLPTEDFTGFIKSGTGTVPNAPNVAAVSLSEPAFVPEHAMVVRIYSRTKNRFESFSYQAGHPR